jgi:N utilization substance protein A
MEVIVPDDYLSIAIGKRGQNVRLASKLTGWHLDVQSESRYNETMKSGYESLVALTDVGVSLADALYEGGFFSVDEISIASVEDLMQVRDMDEEKAQALISAARQAVLDAEAEAEAEGEEDGLQETQENNGDDPSAADGKDAPETAEAPSDPSEIELEADAADLGASETDAPAADSELDLEPRE